MASLQSASRLNLFTQQPMFWAACAYAAGITLASLAWRPLSWWLIAALCLLASSAFWIPRRLVAAAAAVLGALLCLGALHSGLAAATQPPTPDISGFADGDEVVVTAYVLRTGLPRASADPSDGSERREVIDVQTEAVEGSFGRREVSFGIRTTVRSHLADDGRGAPPPSTAFHFGERIRFPAKLREPRNYGNPGAMDYRGYLRDKGIAALASVSVEKLEALEGRAGSPWERWRSTARNSMAKAILAATQAGPGNRLHLTRDDVGLLLAMIIGERSLLERNDRTDFQRAGIFHILVVSGLHVGMLAVFVFWLSRRLRAGPWLSTLTTVAACLAYVAVTDLGTPVQRAAIMLCLYMVSRMLYRDRFSLNAVGTAAGLLLLFAPKTLFEPSFQLTFLSMVALSGVVQPLLEASSQPYAQALRGLELTGYDITLSPPLAQFRLDVRLIASKVAQLFGGPGAYRPIAWLLTRGLGAALWIYDLTVLSVVMQLALALPMIIYFHRLTLLGVPSNILIVPLTGLLMPAALIATLLQLIWPTVAAAVWAVVALCLQAITAVVHTAAAVRFADLRFARPELGATIISAAAFVAAVLVVRRGRWGRAAAWAALVIGAGVIAYPPQPRFAEGEPNIMEVTVIDVGQGDSILLVTPDGKTLLIDGGGPAGPFRTDNFDLGEDVVSPYLWSRGITRLDAVAVTHAHSDHLAGMNAVVANFRPRELWLGMESDPQRYRPLLLVAAQQGTAVRHYYTGDQATLGVVGFTVLNPPRDLANTASGRNEDSLVLQARYRESTVLLTGDAEKKTEERLALSAAHASLLKVAHHGSGTSTSPELLRRTQPLFAVISAGYRNLYGHPRADVLARLREAGVRTYRTDVSGAVTFYLDGTNTSVALPGR